MVSSQQLRNQIPEVVHEVLIQRLCWKASTADAHCLQHAPTPQLMKHIRVLKLKRPASKHRESCWQHQQGWQQQFAQRAVCKQLNCSDRLASLTNSAVRVTSLLEHALT